MRETSCCQQMLGLEKPWRVGEVKRAVQAGQVDLWLEHAGDAPDG